GRCPQAHGAMREVPLPNGGGFFCIDKTEVTADEYAIFSRTTATSPPTGLPTGCESNTDYTPSITTSGKQPVAGVDWCDAWAFCRWAGKRMCGGIGGGRSNALAGSQDTMSQWTFACTNAFDGRHFFPYGNDFDAQACNGLGKGIGRVADVAS